VKIPALQDCQSAAAALAPYIVRTPLIRLNVDKAPAEIYLKLENLQPIGAYKVRCMGHAMLVREAEGRRHGVYTASYGNAGLGLAWMAGKLAIPARVYAPDAAPAVKLDALRAMGASVEQISFADWWQIIERSGHSSDPGLYVDAVRDPAALAGNGTMALEILEELPDVDTIVTPFGGGGVACGIAAALRAMDADVRVLATESEAATPLQAALAAGRPVEVEMQKSFISGIGAPSVLDEMWPLITELLDGSAVVSLEQVVAAVRLLHENNHIVAEGAAAVPVAAALHGDAGTGKVVCVITGGNIDAADMIEILSGRVPGR
jgi:threonine dehydratase